MSKYVFLFLLIGVIGLFVYATYVAWTMEITYRETRYVDKYGQVMDEFVRKKNTIGEKIAVTFILTLICGVISTILVIEILDRSES